MPSLDTIAAPITAPGHAPIAVVRVSGSLCRACIEHLSPYFETILTYPRRLVFSPILDHIHAAETALDHGLIAFFPAPNSFTGEDCAEFQFHGSPFVLGRLLENLTRLGVRLARAGEFSERAFLNGRIDLSQAEAVADLIASETETQAFAAREQLEGKLSEAVDNLGEPLRNLLAEIEAYIDFPDEGIDTETHHGWQERLTSIIGAMSTYLESFSVGRIVREGALVVLVGAPNAGKSSLLNRFLGEERAIVTPIPGTTRDAIEERISLDGLLVRLVDTAGLVDEGSTSRVVDAVEKIGVQLSWKKLRTADLVLYLFDVTGEIKGQDRLVQEVLALKRPVIAVANKSDLATTKDLAKAREMAVSMGLPAPIALSALTGDGLSELRKSIREHLLGKQTKSSQLLISNQRHYEALRHATDGLADALNSVTTNREPEIISLSIREALGALNDIVGTTHTEDILGRIFSKFCIGK